MFNVATKWFPNYTDIKFVFENRLLMLVLTLALAIPFSWGFYFVQLQSQMGLKAQITNFQKEFVATL